MDNSPDKKPIYVTQPHLPPLEEFIPYLEKIWGNKILTNCGPFHHQLEAALCEYLGVEHLALFSNGTLALVTALQALRITGEVITTPYSFVATAHSLLWNGIKPVFADIDPLTLNLDPSRIEAAITPQTTAIMPVHCYGNPCDVDAIQDIADRYNLKVIYDAAHSFGVRDQGAAYCAMVTCLYSAFMQPRYLTPLKVGPSFAATPKSSVILTILKTLVLLMKPRSQRLASMAR
ncbi:hypothetical protein UNDKW_4059 [Undibacterium sp. KW1]|nr:hypothetical protein UNDKW_4059 [Undibacterium sp. KW1]